MAWYTDEQYAMIQDSREKKSIAASAFKQRTHCGKGGSVKFPSDYLSRKELNAMNGECKSYRMNAPMSWSEFVEWPNEHKVSYIKRIREKFGVSDQYIAEMFGVATNIFLMYLKELGLDAKIKCDENWGRQKFYAWRSGAKTELVKENSEPVEETAEEPEEQKTYEHKLIDWDEFKRLTDENKVEYIKWVRETFTANDTQIAKAMNVGRAAFAKTIARLGIGVGKGTGHGKWKKEEFMKWCEMEDIVEKEGSLVIDEPTEIIIPSAGPLEVVDEAFQKRAENIDVAEKALVKLQEAVEPENNNPEDIREDVVEEALMAIKRTAVEVECELAEDCEKKRIHDAGPIAFTGNSMPVIPKNGSMTFENNCADDALQTIKVLLSNARVNLSITWECC